MKIERNFLSRCLTSILFLVMGVTPLIYAWLYIPGLSFTLADILPGLSGFERTKVLFFIALIFLATLCFLFSKKISHQHWVWGGIFGVWTLFSFGVNQDINPYFWWGNGEKVHGWFLYGALLLFTIILSSESMEHKRKYITLSLLSGGVVCLYALFQKLGLDPIQSLYSSRLDVTRIFGTLGNPNYLAGYILMLMPLSLILTQSRKMLGWCLFGFFALILFWTKSFFGIGVFVGYTYYLLLYKYIPLEQKERHRITLSILGIIIVIGVYAAQHYGHQILEVQKIKGFIARYFLWDTGIRALFGDIRNTLFGYGPDGFLPISELFRHPALSVFEDPAYRIDRSHNVWIDLLLHGGILFGGWIIYTIFKQGKKLPVAHREVLVLFSVFFFFNIPVLVHYILLIQILTFPEKTSL